MKTNEVDLVDMAWLGLDEEDLSELKRRENPLLAPRSDFFNEHPGLFEMNLMRNPEYIHWAAEILLGVTLLPEQIVIMQQLWEYPFPMFVASRGFGKSFLLAVYAVLKCALVPGTKIVVVGAAFRQSKVLFEYMETLWYNSPMLRDISTIGARQGPRRDVDRCTMTINDSWAICIPLGDGTKIRGLRAHTIICDEFASISPDIYETVVQGFAAVSAQPWENVKAYAKREALKELGLWNEEHEMDYAKNRQDNQIIISGTADFDFKHFADYWKRYKSIVNSHGDPSLYGEIFDDENMMSEHFSWRDYAIIRVPYELIPKGFMDDKVVARAKATIHSGIYLKEYAACFPKDSDGFFKRTLIESCVATDRNPIQLPRGEVWFDAGIHGNPSYKYVYGIDPGAEVDNFAIVVLELHPDHTRVVYTWTTNKGDFRKRVKAGLTKTGDFYTFCVRKIRDLMKSFPCERIGMDAQGGGNLIMEGLHDKDKMEQGELALWPLIDPEKAKETDGEPGLHIVDMVQFARYDWVSEANHGLRKDMEDKVLLFPRFDSISLELANASDTLKVQAFERSNPGKTLTIYDSIEDCIMEIEELKDELTTIVVTRTGGGVQSRDRWDTPETKTPEGRRGRLRKDRYSALLIANMVARQINRASAPVRYDVVGGFVKDINKGPQQEKMYKGPDWFVEGMNNLKSPRS